MHDIVIRDFIDEAVEFAWMTRLSTPGPRSSKMAKTLASALAA
jgi:hypothetical protein